MTTDAYVAVVGIIPFATAGKNVSYLQNSGSYAEISGQVGSPCGARRRAADYIQSVFAAADGSSPIKGRQIRGGIKPGLSVSDAGDGPRTGIPGEAGGRP